MASHILSLLSCFLLISSSLTSISFATAASSSSDKVALGLYYESLCPYCANFIVNYLPEIFDNGLISIVDLNLVPWGNAKLLSNNTYTCQHGPSECLLDTIEACAISSWPDLDKHFPFINCVEALVHERHYTQWETCFDKLGLDATPVHECYNSGYGDKLELQYAAETNSLQPPHKYVPWVVVDGQPLYEDYENFVSYICKAYKGTETPSACTGLALNTITAERADPSSSAVCYREVETETLTIKLESTLIPRMDQIDVSLVL